MSTREVISTNTVTPARNQGTTAWQVLVILVLIQVLNVMDRQVIQGLLEPIRREFQLSDSQLGLLSGLAYSAAAVLIAIPAGMLADRFSRKVLLTLALSIWTAFTAFCGASRGFTSLVIGRIGTGAAESAAPPASLSIIADSFPAQRQSSATGIFYASSAFGGILAFSVGGYLAQHYGWRTSFYAAAAPAVLLIPIILLFFVEPARATPAAKRVPIGEAFSAIRADKRLALLLVSVPLAAMPLGLMGWIVSLLIRNHGMQLSQATNVLSLATAVFVPAGHFLGGLVGDRLAVWRPGAQIWLSAIAVAFGGLFGIVLALSSDHTVTVVALMCFAFFATLYLAPGFSTVMFLAPAGARATVMAMVTVLGNLAGTGLAPLMAGYISDAIGGPRSLSPAIALVMASASAPAVLFVLIGRRLRSPS